MLYIPKNIDYKLPNGELIGGYLAFKGNIKDIEKYKDQDLLKKYPYIGPLPIFTVPFGGGLLSQLQDNDGKYKGFNKCSLYYENTNCHYSQGCRCYCGHCCRCCTCNHNNINDPNLPFGAVGDKLKKSLQNLPTSIGKFEPLELGDYSINGNKGIYDCYFKDKNGYGYKFNINCEQIPFPKGITPKSGEPEIYQENDKKNKLKPKSNIFQDLAKAFAELEKNIPKLIEKKNNKNKTPQNKHRPKPKKDDEEYKPSKEELKEYQESKNEPKSQLEKNKGKTKENKNKNIEEKKPPKSFIGQKRERAKPNKDDEEYIPSPKELKQIQNQNQNQKKEEKKEEKKSWLDKCFDKVFNAVENMLPILTQKEQDELFKQAEEEFGLNPPKNNSKKKETVEERIIKRCERIQQVGSLALDQHPTFGIAKGIYECIKGEDFVTQEKLSAGERALCGFSALTSLGGKLTRLTKKTETMGGIFLESMEEVTDILTDFKDHSEFVMDVAQDNKEEIIKFKKEFNKFIDNIKKKINHIKEKKNNKKGKK